jgi:hypothetical protein
MMMTLMMKLSLEEEKELRINMGFKLSMVRKAKTTGKSKVTLHLRTSFQNRQINLRRFLKKKVLTAYPKSRETKLPKKMKMMTLMRWLHL